MGVKAISIVASVLVCIHGVEAGERLDWVTVGDPGNVDDTHGAGHGGVAHVYRIGKYEVTNAQYCEFLNAVAIDDPNDLYNPGMAGGFGGITRSGSQGGYTYATITGRANMPVTYVSWYDALRFANWMHNGRPIGEQNALTTEDGAYDMSLGDNVVRKPGAFFFIPTQDEWYKAAYYKGGGTDVGYWDYPTQSDTAPMAEHLPGTDLANGSANYNSVVFDFTYVGSYTAKPSAGPYGTLDQGGNAWEWNETLWGGNRCLRGGTIVGTVVTLRASAAYAQPPSYEDEFLGFRLAASAVLDGDGDVDLEDFAALQAAFTGPR